MIVIPDLKNQLFTNSNTSINYKKLTWIILLIALIYIPYGFFVAKKFDQSGVYINSSYKQMFDYIEKTWHVNPKGLNLQSSYEDWAKAIAGSDASEYIKGGMGIADGKGITLKCLNCKPIKYEPYTFRPPGTSLAIAFIATLLEKNMFIHILFLL